MRARQYLQFEAKFGWSEILGIAAVLIAIFSLWESRTTRQEANFERDERQKAEYQQRILYSYRLGHDIGASQALLMWSSLFPDSERLRWVGQISLRQTQSLIDQLGLNLSIDTKDADTLEAEAGSLRLRVNDTFGTKARDAYILGLCMGKMTGGMLLWASAEEKAKPLILKTLDQGFAEQTNEANDIINELQLNVRLQEQKPLTASFFDNLVKVDEAIISTFTKK